MAADPNELHALLRATSNVDFLRQTAQIINSRLTDLQSAQLGGQGAQLVQPHVQPTDEYRPGPLMGQPLVGPDPQPGGRSNVFQQEQINKETEEGQKASGGRGLGQQPVAVDVGQASEEQKQQARQIGQAQQEQQKKEQEQARQAIQGGQQGGRSGGGGGPTGGQGAAQSPQSGQQGRKP